MFRDLRVMLAVLVVFALIFAVASLLTRQRSSNTLTYFLLAAGELGLLAFLFYRKQRSYCLLTPDGLLVQYPFARVPVPLTSIKRVRVQPLKQAFATPERRRYLNRATKRLLDTAALYLRFDPRDPVFEESLRRLGGRVVYKDDVVLPIAEAEELAAQLRARRVQGG